ncbi:hypothetical protein Trydic_g14543 [Trypoxylus dichotomus]
MVLQIIPEMVYQLAGPRLTKLPVELIAAILRYLDSESLLNAVKAYMVCKNVSLGDPLLRRRLKTLLKEKMKLYGTNLEKRLVVNTYINSKCLKDVQRNFLRHRKRKNVDHPVLPVTKR